jgi:hypothetical protein
VIAGWPPASRGGGIPERSATQAGGREGA